MRLPPGFVATAATEPKSEWCGCNGDRDTAPHYSWPTGLSSSIVWATLQGEVVSSLGSGDIDRFILLWTAARADDWCKSAAAPRIRAQEATSPHWSWVL
ncbi:hypothetical protein GGTG_10647 [Gaeumannomyces tritici R3-111a-1]|uniref:Uncharacterized protein n=1 Tax=Gaeumannomyces tritici (strain R3-111a-1) TaxID=644352 RepID=J3PAX2_GAET3|nr:hypothetical protein GGTG_10647 [Gaeumannomyces tritici R3-111a-1]EJT71388.1 hypothetical protein GGTG_10647 [Gaeumannomyces tritici R3-111a-1]